MIQTMTRSKVHNMPAPDLEQTAAQSARFNVADLEPASLREKEKVKESKEATPRQARRQRGTQPGQQRRIRT